MRFLLMLAAILLPWTVLHAAKDKVLTAAQILDEVVTRPGDFDQMCDPPPAVPYAAPPIPAFGLSVPQNLFPSDEMKALLMAHRAEIVKEMQTRLEKLDWLHPASAPPIPKKPLFVKKEPGNQEFDPTEPSGQNPRALGGIMLSIIGDLDAVELLPQLLKLEDSLHQITQAALKSGKAPVPVIDIGGGAMWHGMMEEEAKLGDSEKVPPAFQRKEDLFHALVFDRQLLGVMLQLLQRKNYAPLKDSTAGLLHTMTLKRKPLDEEMAKIKRPEDIPENERRYIFFDKELGIPYWQHEHADVLYSEESRNEVRGLVQAFVSGTPPPAITGKDLVEKILQDPGSGSQMCSGQPNVAFDAPIPAYGPLARRYIFLSASNRQMLQAHRHKVIPVLISRFQGLHAKQFTKDIRFGGLLEMARDLSAIEALPELLRLEQEIHEMLASYQKDPKTPLPQVDLNSPLSWEGLGQESKAPMPNDGLMNRRTVFDLQVLEREFLGLIGKLLRDEEFEPYFSTALEKGYEAGLAEYAKKGGLPKGCLEGITKEDEIPYEKKELVHWDKHAGVPVSRYQTQVDVPYTDASRDEVLAVARKFLKEIPQEKWKGEAVMDVKVSFE